MIGPALALAVAAAALLFGAAAVVDDRRRRAPTLPPPPPPPGAAAGEPVTVLLPVRDEAANVGPCLDSLLAQSVRPRVLVVDDGSSDGTAALVAARAAGEPRLAWMEAGPLPAGWRGKLHALAAGLPATDTPWVLLSDADTRHAPDLLARALAAAAARRLDLVSLAGRQEARGGENLLVPAVFALLDALLGDWEAAASGAGPAVANGQYILVRRDALARAGGFAAIKDAAIDDVALARRLRDAGCHCGFFRTGGLAVRMYRGLGEAVRGWRRNLGGLFGGRPGVLAAALAATVLPAAGCAVALAAGRPVEAVLLWTAGAAASALLRSGSGHAPLWGLLWPADALLLAAVLALGAADYRRGRLASWKGREMRLS
ncbi:MAG TPA: glycosyltransferase family A protein [Thermoanaerobaculia bacterium]|nr:glycosyltransferase family A protein [Thermoanaerobaculia bacterium]